MQSSPAFTIITIVCLIVGGFSQTTPIYSDPQSFYSNQVTCDLSSGTTITVTLPFTISTVAHRQPFYSATLTTYNSIQTKQFFYYFMEMQSITSTSFNMVHYSMVGSVYYGFNRPCLTGFRYLIVKSIFPEKFISMPLQIASTLWTIPSLGMLEILYDLPTIAPTTTISLSSTDTIFVHSLVNFRLVSNLWTLNASFELKVGFRVVNSTRFGLQLRAKYALTLDTLDDGSVRVFIYNKLEWQSTMYIRMDYQVLNYTNLPTGSSVRSLTYTAVYNPTNTNNIIFGWNGMEFNGYDHFGFQFTLNPVPTGLSYTISLYNRYTASAIPRLDLMVLLASQFRCPNNQILVNTAITLCLTTCGTGFYQSPSMVGITGIYVCLACASTCMTCVGTSTNCTSCFATQNRVLVLNACVPMSGFYETGSPVAPACHYSCLNCSVAATNCTACLATNYRIFTANTCPPMSGYYDAGFALAVPCHYSCATCFLTATNCTSCNPLNFRTLTTNTCPPNAGYYDTGVPTASQCHYSCATCSGGTATDCITCNPVNFRTLSGTSCPPNAGYYDTGVPTASPCHYSCMTCSGTATSCLSCSPTSFRTLTGTSCPPNPGYYDAGMPMALMCHYSCATCSGGTATNCINCNAANFRTLTGTSCPPNAGYYDAGVATASQCHYSCATCSGTSINCISCNPVNFRTLTANTCPPNAGYYDVGVPLTVPCHYSCTTCSINANNCTSCSPSNFRTLTANTCPPNTGYYDTGVPIASSCHYSCLNCTTTPTTCTACNPTSFRTLAGTTCLPNPGYFDSGSSTASPCHYSCETCDISASNCTSCLPSTFRTLFGNTCVPIPGFFENGTSIAAPCHYSCDTCSTLTNCSSCDPLDFRTLTASNTCQPNPGYFDNGSPTAAPCDYTCLTCQTTATTCTSCNSADFRTPVGTTCPPIPGYFDNGTAIAVQCDPSCQECIISATNCTVCVVGSYVSSGSCISCGSTFGSLCTQCTLSGCSACQPGFIVAANNLSCISCAFYHANCLTCNSSACTSCDTTLRFTLSLDNLTCISCTTFDPSCQTCTATTCSACPTGYVVNATSNACITCASYHSSCTSCNSTSCQACAPGFTLDATNSSCIDCTSFDPSCSSCSFSGCSGCQSGYVINATSNLCITCANYHPSCASCNSTSCSSCMTGFALDSLNSTCIACSSFDPSCQSCTFSGCSGCQPGFVLNTVNLCITCASYHPSCTSCNSSNCQSCALGFALDSTNASCVACSTFDASCQDCTFTGCSACLTGFVLSASSGTCITCNNYDPQCTQCNSTNCISCSSGYFVDATNMFCTSCSTLSSACLTCNLTNCQSCAFGSTLDSTLTSCVSCTTFDSNCVSCDPTGCQSCSDGFFLSSGVCQSCSSSFGQQCTNCTITGCTSCQVGYIVNPTDLKCILGVLICGDGLWITSSQACDDGNLLNGDGCDSNCQVETDYVCSPANVLPSGASSCKYTKNLTIEFVSLQKSPSANSISLLFNLEPLTFNQWSTTEIAKLISQIQIVDQKTGAVKNITSANIKVNFVKNELTNQVEMVIDYGANNLEESYLTFTLDPTLTSLTAIQGLDIQSNLMIKISSENSPVYLFDYSEETYDFQNLVSSVCTGVGFMAFAMVLAGFFVPSGKLIMLEGLAVTQIAYFSVLQFQKIPPTFIGLKNLIFSNGYNDGSLLSSLSPAPKDQSLYKLMGLQSEVLSNFNIDLVLFVIAPTLIGGIGYFLTRTPSPTQSTNESPKLLDDKEKQSEPDKSIDSGSSSDTVSIKNVLFGRILYETTFFGLMVSGYLAWVSIFHSQTKPDMTDYAAAGITALFQVAFCVMFVRSEFANVTLPQKAEGKSLSIQTEFGEFSEAYTSIAPKTDSTVLKKFYLIFASERLVNSLVLTLLGSSVPAGALVLGTYTIMLVGMILVFKKTQTTQSFFKPLDKNYVLRQTVNFVTIILIEGLYFGVTLIAQSSEPYDTFVDNDMVVKGVPLGVISLTALNMGFNMFLWVREVKSQNLIMKAKSLFSDLSANVTRTSETSTRLNESMEKYKKEDDQFTAMLNNLRNSSPTLKPKESPFLGLQEATEKKSSILDILKHEKGTVDFERLKKENSVEYTKFIDAQWDEI